MAHHDGKLPPDILLETERLILRRFTADDIDLLVELDADPAVMRFINGGVATPRSEVVEDHLPAFLSYYDRYTQYGFWAADERATRNFVGWFHFRPEPGAPFDQPELGYRLRRSAWGRGYATEGSRGLIDKGFRRDGVRRVTASTMAINTGSRRVMEKLGMTLVRTFFLEWQAAIEGGECGDVEYALERTDWERTSGRSGSAAGRHS